MNHTFTRTNRKLAIVGSHKGTRDGAPYDDPEWDICVFNEAAQNTWVKRWTWVFNIHMEKNLQTTNGIGSANHWDWLQQDHGPDHVIWTQRAMDEIPNSVAYPKDELIERFDPMKPNGEDPFATSTPSWALALGLYLGYEVIHTWGIDLSSNTEYTYQANCWRYWVGVAKGMLGENFQIISGGKQLFKAKLYGYDDDTRSGPDFYKSRAAMHDAKWAEARKLADQTKDALVEILAGKGDVASFMDAFRAATDAQRAYGGVQGAMGEAVRFAERSDILHRQEFEWHAAKSQEEARPLERRYHVTIGHLEVYFNSWAHTKDFNTRNKVAEVVDKLLGMARDIGFLVGKSNECIYYLQAFDKLLTEGSGAAVNDEVLAAQNVEVEK